MSSNVLPVYAGLTFSKPRTTSYKTLSDSSLSLRVANLALQQYPIHSYDLNYEILHDDISPSEVKAIVGLFNACAGRFDSFLYTDPVFNTVTAERFGTGDGVSTNFQVIATFQNSGGPGGPDIVQNFNGLPSIFDNNSLVTVGTGYTLGPTGIVTFATPPTAGHALTWTGGFYQRCHFLNDTLEVQRFMNKWWQIDSLAFQSVLL